MIESPTQSVEDLFSRLKTTVDFLSLRYVNQRSEAIRVRQNVLQPVAVGNDVGVMLTTAVDGSGWGYAATSDLTLEGLQQAAEEAAAWAHRSREHGVFKGQTFSLPAPRGEYYSPLEIPWEKVGLKEKIDLLRAECERLQIDRRIQDWEASLTYTTTDSLLLTSNGGRVQQRFHYIVPMLSASANQGAETQTRTLGGRGSCRQGGWEVFGDAIGFCTLAPQIADEALQLLTAPNCPAGKMQLLLAPDQMVLQIHESIGHPLELDRILGDERNYAGTSFVTLDMFGSYRYGSDLLNVTFDPSVPQQFASYGFDDDGTAADKAFVIRAGILQRPLGGMTSQWRAALPGVANARACSWNRPPIDRMANLNLEAGGSTLNEMIAATEHGVYMKTNVSWSIDDSRNKFQFGCEWGQLIENGELTTVVKSPNYRGISAVFWRDLEMVGNVATADLQGTPYCGKGEPNQMIHVGHASPTCLFKNVDVFGGA